MTSNGMPHPALSPNPTLSIVLADQNSLTRDCFALSLGTLCEDMAVHPVPSLKDVGTAVGRAEGSEVVLYNIGSEPLQGTVAADVKAAVSALHPVPLVIVSDRDDIDMILESLRLGVRGYIVSSLGLGVTLEAIRLVAAGGTFVPATSLHKLSQPAAHRNGSAGAPPVPQESIGGLTPREMAVLNCLREGKSNKIIAYQLGMCENTAKAHVRNVLKKLGATNRTEAAYLAHTHQMGGQIGNASSSSKQH